MFDEIPMVAGVVETEEISESQETGLKVLEGRFSSGEAVYQLQLQSDGTGKIFYGGFPDDFEEFDHEIKVEELAREIEEAIENQITLQSGQMALEATEIEEIRQETATDILTEVFWEQINQTLEDPFFRSFEDSDWGEEFSCQQGTVEELTEFLKLSVLTERTITDANDFLIVEAENDFEEAGLSECSYHTERLGELVKIACEYYQPKGFCYSYNDGCYDRMSGYSMDSETISVSLAEFVHVPSREKMLAMKELRKQLQKIGVEFEKIKALTFF